MEVAKYIISDLREILIELVDSFSPQDGSAKLVSSGEDLTRLLLGAEDILGFQDARVIDEKHILKEMYTFIEDSKSFDQEVCNSKNQALIIRLVKVKEQLDKSLSQTWNSELDSVQKPDLKTPVKSLMPKRIFHKFTPISAKESIYTCPAEGCGKTSKSVRYLRDHVKKTHEGITLEIQELRGTCRLPKVGDPTQQCGAKEPKDQMNRHLKVCAIKSDSLLYFLLL